MKKLAFILIISFLAGCTKPIMLKRYKDSSEKIEMFGNNSNHNFFVDIKNPPHLNLEWQSSTHGSFSNTSFAAYDTLIFVSDQSGRVIVFNLTNGKKNGELKFSGGIEQSVVLSKSYLLFIVNDLKERYSTLVVYDFVNGNKLKSLRLKGQFRNELVSIGDFIFAVSDFGKLYKISRWGTIEWQKDLKTQIYSNPTADNKFIYLATIGGNILKVSILDGEIISDKKIGNPFQSGITMDGYNIYVGDDKGIMYSINKKSLAINWQYNSSFKIIQTPALDNSDIFFGNLTGDIFSLKKKTGQVNWSYKTKGLINASPLVFSNIILQPNLDRRIDIFDKFTGKLLNQVKFDSRCRTTPIFFKNRIFVGVDRGEVYCYSFINDDKVEGK